MSTVSTLCILLLFVIVSIWLCDYCTAANPMAAATSYTTEGMTAAGAGGAPLGGILKHDNTAGFPASTNVAPVEKGSIDDGSNPLNQYFQNPSKTLNVPATVSYLQDVVKNEESHAIDEFGKQMNADITKSSFDIKDFLPQEIHEEWFQTDLSTAKKDIDQASLIDISKLCQGVDTIGQSLKNPSYDIRGNIPNPKIVVSPFLNSSYEPDTNIKSWC